MSEYTKGPWKAVLGEVHEVRDSDGGRICILTQLCGPHGLGGRRDAKESPANAHLIAASTFMHEVLSGIAKADQSQWDETQRSAEAFRDWAKSIAAHAIAKAEPLAQPNRPEIQGGDYRPHYPARTATPYMDALEIRVAALEAENAALRVRASTPANPSGSLVADSPPMPR